MTWLNVGCGTWRADPPWVNLDVADNDEVHPDVLCEPGEPLPFDDGVAEQVFAGHVFEHTAWEDIPRFVAELARVLEPGGELLVVGPDVHRAIRRYAQGTEPWDIVIACLEHVTNLGFDTDDQWPNARHHWNCDEGRVVTVLEASECFATVKAIPVPDHVIERDAMPPWPIVGFAPWQAAVLAVK